MTLTNRLTIINKIAYDIHSGKNTNDLPWIIGMLSDPTLKGKNAQKEIKRFKKEFPEYNHYWE